MNYQNYQNYQHANVVLKNLKQVAKTTYINYDMHSAFTITINGDNKDKQTCLMNYSSLVD